MSATRTRRPLPALIFLLVLLLAAAVVWWRVLQNGDSASTGKKTVAQPTFSLTCAPTPITLPKPAAINVTVLNGNGTTGLAQKITNQLKSEGFAVGTPGDAGANYSGQAQIRFGAKGRDQAQALSYYLTGSTFLMDNRVTTGVDLVLGTTFTRLRTLGNAQVLLFHAQRPCSS